MCINTCTHTSVVHTYTNAYIHSGPSYLISLAIMCINTCTHTYIHKRIHTFWPSCPIVLFYHVPQSCVQIYTDMYPYTSSWSSHLFTFAILSYSYACIYTYINTQIHAYIYSGHPTLSLLLIMSQSYICKLIPFAPAWSDCVSMRACVSMYVCMYVYIYKYVCIYIHL
jgi:hypothetical protein